MRLTAREYKQWGYYYSVSFEMHHIRELSLEGNYL